MDVRLGHDDDPDAELGRHLEDAVDVALGIDARGLAAGDRGAEAGELREMRRVLQGECMRGA